jgi:hypothetical protein
MVHYVDFFMGMHFRVIQEGFDQAIGVIEAQCIVA